MPIYTYRCENCGVQFDQQQHFSDLPLTRCPECNHKTLRKVFTPVGIVFKGSGFYATDNRSPSGASWASSDKNGDKSGEKPVEKHNDKNKEGGKTAETTPSGKDKKE
jgi:putative FmdB family regulatory protein